MALLWLLLWQALALLVGRDFILASPLQVLARLLRLLLVGDTYLAALHSMLRILLGFFLGALLGSLVAAAGWRSAVLRAFFAPAIAALRAVPVASFVILALILVSSTWLSALIALVIALPVVHGAVLEGLGQGDVRLREMAQVFRVPGPRRLIRLTLPQLAPFLRAGLTTAMALSWKSGIAAELIGIPGGSIGEKLYTSKVHLDSAGLLAWTIIIVGLSWLCAAALKKGLGAIIRKLEGA